VDIKGPNKGGVLGDIREYMGDPWAFVNDCHEKYGHRVKLRMLHQRAFLISHADDIMAILQEKPDSFVKGRTFKKLKLLLGEGLITSEGENWKKQNRLMRPVFGLKHMYNLVPSIQQIIMHHCQWKDQSTVNIHAEMNELTLKIIARTLFALDLSEEAPTFLKDVEYMMHFLIKRVRTIAAAPMWMPLPSHREFFAARARFDGLIERLLQQRRQNGAIASNDLLQILMDAITNSMAWTMIELAKHPEYQERLAAESQSFWVDSKLQEAPFNKVNLHLAVMDEGMRLWPPVWAFMRQAGKNVNVNGLELKKGDIVFLMPFFAQRSKDFWQDPLAFRPERFLPPERENMKAGAYFPFGLGPRMCIGKIFAQVEAKLILSHLCSQYQWGLPNPEKQTVEAGITLRATNNIHLKVTKR
jgi:cytochrome P450